MIRRIICYSCSGKAKLKTALFVIIIINLQLLSSL